MELLFYQRIIENACTVENDSFKHTDRIVIIQFHLLVWDLALAKRLKKYLRMYCLVRPGVPESYDACALHFLNNYFTYQQ